MWSIINKNLIDLNIEDNSSKEQIIRILSKMMSAENRLNNYDKYVENVLIRENLFTTGFGYGIAIPHGKCSFVKVPTVAIGRINKGVNWDSLDENLVHIIFLIAVPEEASSCTHLKIIAELARSLIKDQFREDLLNACNKDAFFELLKMELNEGLYIS